jgi:hypothetical protein
MTVVTEKAGFELVGEGGPPLFVEQAETPAISTSTPSPAALPAIRRLTAPFLLTSSARESRGLYVLFGVRDVSFLRRQDTW